MKWLALVPVLALSAEAQPTGGVLTKSPVVTHFVEAAWPADAGLVGAEVVVQLDVGADGVVTEAHVTKSGGPGFDEAALEALRAFTFSPGEVDGQPAPVRLEYTYTFSRPVGAPDAGVVATLRGEVREAGTREPLSGASVLVGSLELQCDDRGVFEAAVAVGSVRVVVTSAGHERFEAMEEIHEGVRTEVIYSLEKTAGRETVVRAPRDRREVNQVRLSRAELGAVAGTGGDAFKVLQSLPGTSRTAFGAGALVVRGSKAWDSRVLVDEIEIPQLFHFAGLNSTYASAQLESLAFEPGNWGVEYGRGIGGLVQATTRSVTLSGVHGFADVSTNGLAGLVETKLTDRWSVSVSARRGLADVTLPFALRTFAPQVAAALGFSVAPVTFDYQLRAERKGEGKNRVFVSLFGSQDRYAFITPNPFLDTDTEGNQGTQGNSTSYHRLVVGIDQRLTDQVTFVSRNSIGLDDVAQLGGATDVFFHVRDVPIQLRERVRVEVPSLRMTLSTGLDVLVVPSMLEAQSSPQFKANLIPDPYVERRLLAERSTTLYVEPGGFAEARWNPVESLVVTGGVRADGDTVMKQAWVDPRISVLWKPLTPLTVKGGAGLYHQPPDHRAGQRSAVFGNPALTAEGAWHGMAGAEYRFTEAISLEGQGYYKGLFSQARQVLASGLGSDINIPGAETRFSNAGYGRAYGMEVLLRHALTKHLFGWVSYSLSRFERDYYGGVAYAPGPLDQPHNLVVVASYAFPFDIVAGARFRFSSGPLVTPVVASLYDSNGNYFYPLPGLPWSRRLPDFAQLDVRVDKRFTFRDWSLVAYVDVQNVTNHQNPEGLLYNFNYTKSDYVSGLPILPSVGARGEW